MAQFSNSFELLGARDFQQLIVVVDERTEGSFLEESKRKAAEEERRKKEEEKQKVRLDIQKKLCYGGQRNSTTGSYDSGNRYNQQRDFNSHRFSSRPKTEDAISVSSTTSAVSQISFGTVSNGGSGVDLKRNINGVEKEEAEAVVEIQQEEQGDKAPEQADKTPEQGDKTQLESNGVNESSSKKSSEGFVRRKINGSVRRKMKKTKSKGCENGGAANDSSAAATAAAPTAPHEKKFTRVLTLKEYEKMKAEKDKPTVVQQPSKSEDQQQHPQYRQQHPAYHQDHPAYHHQNHPTHDQQNRPKYGQQYPAYQQNRHAYHQNRPAYNQNNAGQFNKQNDRSWNPEKDRRGKQGFEGNRSRQAKPKAPFELDNIAEFPSLKSK
ncbi:uncharacterized protein [Pyrus communis]|uniref:uncharacterized protein n=1 Tax=Pyrus communis TaxID=23211 RepID=UPI0035BEC2F7